MRFINYVIMIRLDAFLAEKGLFPTRNKAKESISRGEVLVEGKVIKKPAFAVSGQEEIKIIATKTFVSLGGYKMDKAISEFSFSPRGKVAVDVGASTGGFTDCLLRNGAKKVYAVDLNEDLLAPSLKEDERVIEVIKNAKDLSVGDFDERPDLAVIDLSFISATMVLSVVYEVLSARANLILLIKPQFEQNTRIKTKNGIIRDEKLQKAAVEKVISSAKECGFSLLGLTSTDNPADKNKEFLALFEKNAQ